MSPRRPATASSDSPPADGLPDPAGQELVSLWGAALEGFAEISRVLADELDTALGIPMTWAEVLFRLRRTPGELLPSTRLARDVSFSSGGFTKLMDRLVEAKLVERQACPTDRRVVYAALTPRGRELADRALEVHIAGLRRHVLDVIGEERLRALGDTMRHLHTVPRDGEASPSL
jgi:DNA-binding MarR family transcriptional regulator